MIEVGSI